MYQQVDSIQQRAKAVEQRQSQLEAELEQLYRKALNDLRKQTERKLNILLGDQLELERQVQEINYLEQFLEYQQTGIDVFPLLFNWSKHLLMRQNLHDFRHFRNEIDVWPDLKVWHSI